MTIERSVRQVHEGDTVFSIKFVGSKGAATEILRVKPNGSIIHRDVDINQLDVIDLRLLIHELVEALSGDSNANS